MVYCPVNIHVIKEPNLLALQSSITAAGFAVFYNGLAYIGNGNPDQPSEDVSDMLFHKAALCIDTDLPPAGVCKLVLHRLT